MKALLALGLATLIAPLACGPVPSDASDLAAGPADLRFSGIPVQVLLPSTPTPVAVANGATFHVPCNTSGFRARYRYENAGQSAAAAHTNASGVVGGTTYPFAQAALASGTLRYAYASFGQIAVPNVETKLAIRLDAPGVGVVAEALETNNVWVAKVVRDCP